MRGGEAGQVERGGRGQGRPRRWAERLATGSLGRDAGGSGPDRAACGSLAAARDKPGRGGELGCGGCQVGRARRGAGLSVRGRAYGLSAGLGEAGPLGAGWAGGGEKGSAGPSAGWGSGRGWAGFPEWGFG